MTFIYDLIVALFQVKGVVDNCIALKSQITSAKSQTISKFK